MGLFKNEIKFNYFFKKKYEFYFTKYLISMEKKEMLFLGENRKMQNGFSNDLKIHYKKLQLSYVNSFNYKLLNCISNSYNQNLLSLRNYYLHDNLDSFKIFHFNTTGSNSFYNGIINPKILNEMISTNIFSIIILIFTDVFLYKELNLRDIYDSDVLKKILSNSNFNHHLNNERDTFKYEINDISSIDLNKGNLFDDITTNTDLIKDVLIFLSSLSKLSFEFKLNKRELFIYLLGFLKNHSLSHKNYVKKYEKENFILFHYFDSLIDPHNYYIVNKVK